MLAVLLLSAKCMFLHAAVWMLAGFILCICTKTSIFLQQCALCRPGPLTRIILEASGAVSVHQQASCAGRIIFSSCSWCSRAALRSTYQGPGPAKAVSDITWSKQQDLFWSVCGSCNYRRFCNFWNEVSSLLNKHFSHNHLPSIHKGVKMVMWNTGCRKVQLLRRGHFEC